jgi:hypothetical protein
VIYLLFYKAPGNIWDKIIRLVTKSKYSHVEIAFEKIGDTYRCWSSATRNNVGVRMAWQNNAQDIWDIIELPNNNCSEQLFLQQNGKGYDYIGLLGTIFKIPIFNSKDKWFCSEIIAEALGVPNSYKCTPQDLYKMYS